MFLFVYFWVNSLFFMYLDIFQPSWAVKYKIQDNTQVGSFFHPPLTFNFNLPFYYLSFFFVNHCQIKSACGVLSNSVVAVKSGSVIHTIPYQIISIPNWIDVRLQDRLLFDFNLLDKKLEGKIILCRVRGKYQSYQK